MIILNYFFQWSNIFSNNMFAYWEYYLMGIILLPGIIFAIPIINDFINAPINTFAEDSGIRH